MKKIPPKPLILTLVIFCILLLVLLVILVIDKKPMPVALLQEFGVGLLWEEALAMNECAECHKAVDFHSCETCHDDHGAVELAGIMFFEVIELTGDVPKPSFVRLNEIIPNQENLGTHILLFDFLEKNGINQFDSVSFITNDGGLTTIKQVYLDETAMLVPFIDGVRFVTESVHVSTWLKGIKKIIVVGSETPLTIDGQPTSMGRLLIGDTVRITIEGSEVMLTDEEGKTGYAYVANWAEGAKLTSLLNHPDPAFVTITDSNGDSVEFTGKEVENAVLAIIRQQITLVLPDRGRGVWPTNIVQIESRK